MIDINGKMIICATAAFGLEAVVERELKWIGIENSRCENGRVYFEGTYLDVAKCNVHLRCADRILIVAGSFKALTFTELFDGTSAIEWEKYLPLGCRFPVEGKSVKSVLKSVPNCQKIVKKSICERLKKVYGCNDILPEDGALHTIEISMLNDTANITIDTSGAGLNRRGYRRLAGPAPIKETLAAGMIMVSRWNPDRALLDPFCGTGTIPIEAAMIGKNMAPGMRRAFDAEEWSDEIREIFAGVKSAAESAVDKERKLTIYASDIDYESLKLAREHAEEADVADCISFQKLDFRDTSSKAKYGFIITNPPYGIRISDKKSVTELYREMGKHFTSFDTWSSYIITPDEEFERHYGRRADKKRKLYNGTIKCDYCQFWGPKPVFKEKNI